jgi:hypothetical protein
LTKDRAFRDFQEINEVLHNYNNSFALDLQFINTVSGNYAILDLINHFKVTNADISYIFKMVGTRNLMDGTVKLSVDT